jgi:hypothetical protein
MVREPNFEMPTDEDGADGIRTDAPEVADTPAEVLPSADEAALTLAETALAVEQTSERVRTARASVQSARSALNAAIENWRGAWPKLTPLENVRQYQQRSLTERAAQVDAPAPAPTPVADSAIDRQAKYSKGGQPQARYGSFRRGGRDVSQFGQRVKLPSEK